MPWNYCNDEQYFCDNKEAYCQVLDDEDEEDMKSWNSIDVKCVEVLATTTTTTSTSTGSKKNIFVY